MRIGFQTTRGGASQPGFWPEYWKPVDANFNTKYQPEFPVLLRQLSSTEAHRILEIGCGRGQVVRKLRALGYDVRGLDFDADSVLDSMRSEGHFPGDIGDLNYLPYPNNAYDAILLAGTVEHVYGGPEKGFSEAFRVLKPGGLVVLTIPYINLVRKLVLPFYLTRDWWFSYFPEARKEKFFEYVFTRSEVVRILSRAGFQVKECQRAYYTTVLRKIPGVKAATKAIFGGRRNGSSSGTEGHGWAPGRSASLGIKHVLKFVIEGTLNGVIPNRLIVVAQKPSVDEAIA
jgi:SAM-dependent methyltransferase